MLPVSVPVAQAFQKRGTLNRGKMFIFFNCQREGLRMLVLLMPGISLVDRSSKGFFNGENIIVVVAQGLVVLV